MARDATRGIDSPEAPIIEVGRPVLIGYQFLPPSLLLSTPPPVKARRRPGIPGSHSTGPPLTKIVAGALGSIIRLRINRMDSPMSRALQLVPPLVLLKTS